MKRQQQPTQLSIVTCTKNSEYFLGDLLNSIETQTVLPYEHIFVDASSDDRTQELINDYKLRTGLPVKFIPDQTYGIADGMNQGARHATGTHLLFLQSDDKLHSKLALEHLLDDLQPQADWYVSNCAYMDESGRIIDFAPKFPRPLSSMFRGNVISHPSVVMRRTFFESCGGFRAKYKLAMDYDLWLRILKISQPQQSSLVLSNFRIHSHGASSGNPIALAKETLFAKLSNNPPLKLALLAVALYFFEVIFISAPNARNRFIEILSQASNRK